MKIEGYLCDCCRKETATALDLIVVIEPLQTDICGGSDHYYPTQGAHFCPTCAARLVNDWIMMPREPGKRPAGTAWDDYVARNKDLHTYLRRRMHKDATPHR